MALCSASTSAVTGGGGAPAGARSQRSRVSAAGTASPPLPAASTSYARPRALPSAVFAPRAAARRAGGAGGGAVAAAAPPAATAGRRRAVARASAGLGQSPAAPEGLGAPGFDAPAPLDAASRDEYMAEYAALKQRLLRGARTAGGVVGLYLLFAVDGEAALCALVGAAAGYGYLLLLMRDVDAVSGDDEVPLWQAEALDAPGPVVAAAKLVAAYRHALQPRLLVPVALAATLAGAAAVAGGPVERLDAGCVLLGFLCYKGGLLGKLWEDLAPKAYGSGRTRPRVEPIEDGLDVYGRPKKRMAQPTDVLPENAKERAEALELVVEARDDDE